MKPQALKLPPVIPEVIALNGGLDRETPAMQLPPGFVRSAQNYECAILGGYRRIAGYERVDGRAAPSDGVAATLAVSAVTGGSVGDTVVGATSAASGHLLAKEATYWVLTAVSGTFVDEDLNIGGLPKAHTTGGSVSVSAKLTAQYKNLAADYYRGLIGAVPGSGNILGLVYFNNVLYAFRNNAGGTAAALYKSASGGWTAVALGRELLYTNGNLQIAEGTTITGATSGATAVLKRQTVRTGTVGAATAVGTFVFASVTGAFQNGENLQTGGVTRAVANGADAAITLLPSGRYEFDIYNFTGSTNTKRIYGCDGVNLGFEFDGTTYVPIRTGMTTDTPTHVKAHKYHLVFSFIGGSVQHSSTGFPYLWTPVTGGAELALGEDVSGFEVQPAGTGTGTGAATLAIFTNGKLWILYGNTSADWNLVPYRDQIGARAYSIQTLAQSIFLDQQGITDLRTAQAYGNFVYATLTNRLKTTVTGLRDFLTASTVNRDLAQYRAFFSNGYGLYLTMRGEKVVGCMPVVFPHVVRCACNGQKNSGEGVSFFGASDGYVYQLDKGTSFDGGNIDAFIYLAYAFSGGPRMIKRYRQGAVELTGTDYAEFAFGYALGFNDAMKLQPTSETLNTTLSSALWDASGLVWDTGTWDASNLKPVSFVMDGEAENVSVTITSTNDWLAPFTVTGLVIHHSPRRPLR